MKNNEIKVIDELLNHLTVMMVITQHCDLDTAQDKLYQRFENRDGNLIKDALIILKKGNKKQAVTLAHHNWWKRVL